MNPMGNLEIEYKKSGVVENTLGRVLAAPSHLLLLTPDAIFKDAPAEMVAYLAEKFKDVNWKGNPLIRLNRSPLFAEMKRLFGKDRRMNLFVRILLGLPVTFFNSILGKIARSDRYNPYTETAQIFHKNPAIAMQETGRALNFDESEHPFWRAVAYVIPIVRSAQDWEAGSEAMKRLNTDERKAAQKVLEPKFGSAAGADIGRLFNFAFPPAQGVSSAAGLLMGHIHGRLADKNIFFNGKTIPN